MDFPHLSHELVLVAIHASELADMSECVLQAVCQLEGIDVAKTVLHMGVDNKLCETQDLADH